MKRKTIKRFLKIALAIVIISLITNNIWIGSIGISIGAFALTS